MQVTIIGSGDAFGSGGRGNTCFHLRTAKATLLVDIGASAMPALKARGIALNDIDGIVLSHLHGDHFGGLPFFFLDSQFHARREKPLAIAGPSGTRERIVAAMEVFFPKSSGNKWRFEWSVSEIPLDTPSQFLGHSLRTTEVIHNSGAPSTALRLGDGESVFAYSGDTGWTDALLPIAKDADLFICECYAHSGKLTGHMTWEILQTKLHALGARQTMITHMSPSMLARTDDARALGVLIAQDGLELDV